MRLSQYDVNMIARMVATEVDRSLARTAPRTYSSMVRAVVDTVTNRVASPNFPNTVIGVLNEKRAFSKIAGPKRLKPYGKVENAPNAPRSLLGLVTEHLQARAKGLPSTIGGATHYANPEYSDKKNRRGWIDPMIEAGAKKIGIGNAVHYHGVPPGMSPAPSYEISLDDNVAVPSGYLPDMGPQIAAAPSVRESLPALAALGMEIASTPPTTGLPSPAQVAGTFDPGGILSPPDISFSPISAAIAEERRTAPAQAKSPTVPEQYASYGVGRAAAQEQQRMQEAQKTLETVQAMAAEKSARMADLAGQYASYGAGKAPAMPSAPATAPAGLAEQYAMYGAGKAMPAPAIKEQNRVAAAPVFSPVATPPPVAAPVPTPRPTPATPAAVAFPVDPSVSASSFPSAPAMPSAPSARDFWSGQSTYGVANNGALLSRDALGNTYHYSPKYDYTEVTTPQGFRSTKQGIYGPLSPEFDESKPSFSGLGKLNTGKIAGVAKGMAGAAAGGLAGSALAGPIGGLLGAALGKSLASGQGFKGVFGNKTTTPGFGMNSFPAAPQAPAGSYGGPSYSGLSHGEMMGISPAATAAIDAGKAGLW